MRIDQSEPSSGQVRVLVYRLALLVGWAVVGLPAASRASTFDESSGHLSVEDAAWSLSFEPGQLHDLVLAYDDDWRPVPTRTVARRVVEDADALEGEGLFVKNADTPSVVVQLWPAVERLSGRQVEVRLWIQPRGQRPAVALAWYQAGRTLALVPLVPTGRGTDDGWRELSTGPVDFLLAGLVPPAYLLVTDRLVPGDPLTVADDRSDTALDALEIVDLGVAVVPDAPCTMADETVRCGAQGACWLGRCVDAAVTLGPRLRPPVAAAYRDRLGFEISSFEGIRDTQGRLAAFQAVIDEGSDPASPQDFWRSLRAAWELLHDGHGYPPAAAWAQPLGAGACLHLGEADWLPEGGTAPMVFRTAPDHPVGRHLRVGDVLRSIDGLAPGDWTELAGRAVYYPGDPANRSAITAMQLLGAALTAGSQLTFARCPDDGTRRLACDEAEVEEIDLDTGALVGTSIWDGRIVPELDETLLCDGRFARIAEGPGIGAHDFAAFEDRDGVRIIQWNGWPYPAEDLDGWVATMGAALEDGPALLLLDERLGAGGPPDGWGVVLGNLLAEGDELSARVVPWLAGDLDGDLLGRMHRCVDAEPQYSGCGGYWEWSLPAGWPRAAAASRVAVLTSQDVSGNDYFTRFIRERSAPTRLFGPGPTYGAFGPMIHLSAHGVALAGGTVQRDDTFFTREPAPETWTFESGHGVAPHEVVWQRQSDALRGVDTLVEAARQWLRSEGGDR